MLQAIGEGMDLLERYREKLPTAGQPTDQPLLMAPTIRQLRVLAV